MRLDPNEENEPVHSDPGGQEAVDCGMRTGPHTSLMRRQLLFLRKTWWSSEPLTGTQRLALLLRGLLFMAVGGIGLVAAVANTVSGKAAGMEAVAKMIAEFLLIPIGILGLMIVGFGGSLIVRSFVAPSLGSGLSD